LIPGRGFALAGAASLVVLLGACAHAPVAQPVPEAVLEPVSPESWPEFVDDLQGEGLSDACAASLHFFQRSPGDRVFAFGAWERTADELAEGVRRACQLADLPVEERGRALRDEFVLLRSVGRDGHGEVFFTGYYEPLLDARRIEEAPFIHPIYGLPDDLVTVHLADFTAAASTAKIVGRIEDRRLVPYPERAAIDFGTGLVDGVEVLGWVDDPVDVFFLHVQGSGTLIFDDGDRLRAGYAATNGRPYRSIGRLLIDDGLVSSDEMSMQAIRAYLENHPDELNRVLSYNPSYVFFRPLPPTGGPLGCYGEPVTGGRSVATDRSLFPAPVMAWIRAVLPTLDGGEEEVARFVLNQDTGGSIKGPGRVDLFVGQGEDAGAVAGRTKHTGELYFLIPKRNQE
jgi:membrane-bound lytic murein transglycosylase A